MENEWVCCRLSGAAVHGIKWARAWHELSINNNAYIADWATGWISGDLQVMLAPYGEG